MYDYTGQGEERASPVPGDFAAAEPEDRSRQKLLLFSQTGGQLNVVDRVKSREDHYDQHDSGATALGF